MTLAATQDAPPEREKVNVAPPVGERELRAGAEGRDRGLALADHPLPDRRPVGPVAEAEEREEPKRLEG